MNTEAKRKFLIDFVFLAVIIAIIYFTFKFMSAYLLPFVIGILVSFIVQKPVRFINKKTKLPKSLTTIVLVVLSYFAILGVITLIAYGLYSWLYSLTKFLPGIIPEITSAIKGLGVSLSKLLDNVPQNLISTIQAIPENAISTLTNSLTSVLSSVVTKLAAATPSVLISTIVTVVASCYIAKDYDTIIEFAFKHMPQKVWSILIEVKELFTKTIFRLLRGYLLLMIITFVELSIGLALIGHKNFITLAAIISVIDILPVLGTGGVVIPWAIISLLTGDVLKAIFLLLIYVIITVVRNFLEPKVIGEQVGLHPLVTLLSIFVGYRVMGFIGIFLFPITLIVLHDLYKKGTIKFLNSNSKITQE
ncbi:MAG: sporulation integral membrane protein YtvI [Clostridia bacterium]|nr:sporulation integral membrane protein YtvI [Clostridia bacterium]